MATGFGCPEFDSEGRYTRVDCGELTVISLYAPSGSSSPERQEAKFRFMDVFLPHLQALQAEGREVVVCGDWNIAHKEIDLKNWKGNRKNSGFLPEERAWMTRIFDELGLVDVHRVSTRNPSSTPGGATAARPGPRTSAGASTTTSPPRASAAKRPRVSVYKDERFSDHAPLIIDYALMGCRPGQLRWLSKRRAGAGQRILEADRPRQQLQRGGKIVALARQRHRIEGVVQDRHAQRGHVQAQLVLAPGVRMQAVARQAAAGSISSTRVSAFGSPASSA